MDNPWYRGFSDERYERIDAPYPQWDAHHEELLATLPPLWRQYLDGPLHDSWVTSIRREGDVLEIMINHWVAQDYAYAWEQTEEVLKTKYPLILRFKGVSYASSRRALPNRKLVWSSWDNLHEEAMWISDGFFQTSPTLQLAVSICSHQKRGAKQGSDLICLIEAEDLEIIELQEEAIRKLLGDEPADIWQLLLEESKTTHDGIPVMRGTCCMDHYLVERFGEAFTQWKR